MCLWTCIYVALLLLSSICFALTARALILWCRCAKRGKLRRLRSRRWSTILFCGAPTNCCRSTCLPRLYKLCAASLLPSSRLFIQPFVDRRMLCECAKEPERPRKWSLSRSLAATPFRALRACACVFAHHELTLLLPCKDCMCVW
jgi:hypothetical protein